jgi:hypothetical protein
MILRAPSSVFLNYLLRILVVPKRDKLGMARDTNKKGICLASRHFFPEL